MANRESADAVRGQKRRKSVDIGSVERSASRRGDIEERRPTLDELRSLRRDNFIGGTSRRTAPAPRMVSAAVSRSGSTTSRSISSKHRVKRSSSHRVDSDGKVRRKKRTTSKDGDSPQIYVYGSPKETRERKSSRIQSETRTLGRDDDSCDSVEGIDVLPVVSEEPELKPKTRKIRVIYVDDDKARSSRHSSRRTLIDHETSTKDRVKVVEKPLHRSNTTNSRRSTILSPLEGLKRCVVFLHACDM